jgi:TM2 domain-containing membrane protein YozV
LEFEQKQSDISTKVSVEEKEKFYVIIISFFELLIFKLGKFYKKLC